MSNTTTPDGSVNRNEGDVEAARQERPPLGLFSPSCLVASSSPSSMIDSGSFSPASATDNNKAKQQALSSSVAREERLAMTLPSIINHRSQEDSEDEELLEGLPSAQAGSTYLPPPANVAVARESNLGMSRNSNNTKDFKDEYDDSDDEVQDDRKKPPLMASSDADDENGFNKLRRNNFGGLNTSSHRPERADTQDLTSLKPPPRGGGDHDAYYDGYFPEENHSSDEEDDDEDDSIYSSSTNSVDTEEEDEDCGVIAIGIPDKTQTTESVNLAQEEETPPPKTKEEAIQRAVSQVVAENLAEEEHNIKQGEKAAAAAAAAALGSRSARRRSSTRQSFERKPAPAVSQHDEMIQAKNLERQRSRSLSSDDGAAANRMERRRLRPAVARASRASSGVERLDDEIRAKMRAKRTYSSSDDSMTTERRLPPSRYRSNTSNESSDSASYSLARARASLRSREEAMKIRGHQADDDDRGPSLAPASSAAVAHRANIRSHQEMAKLQQQEEADSGPSLAPATSSAAAAAHSKPGAFPSVLHQDQQKGKDSGPSLAPATSSAAAAAVPQQPGAFPGVLQQDQKGKDVDSGPCLASGRDPLVSALESAAGAAGVTGQQDDEEGQEEIEAQAGIPVAFPGAFAIEGMDAGHTDSAYDTDMESDAGGRDEEAAEAPHANFVAQSTLHEIPADEPVPLEAELQVVVDGAVVTDDDEEEVDPKTIRRLRMVQMAIVCFSIAAIGLIIGSILGFTNNGQNENEEPPPLGWIQVGTDLYGPAEEPQVFFGAAVAMTGGGSRLAVSAPGTDKETTLNLGQVRIFDEAQGENGTKWVLNGTITGMEPSEEPKTALAMSKDGRRIALGRPFVANASVGVYEETGQTWSLVGSLDGPATNGDNPSWFGYSVDLSSDGNILVTGAPLSDSSNGERTGAVRVYKYTGSNWTQLGLDILGTTLNEFLGWSVTVQASKGGIIRVAAGGPTSDAEKGVVRVYGWSGTLWEQVGATLVGESALNRFGESVAMSEDGSVLAVGARGTAFESGQAYVFRETNSQWVADSQTFLGEEPAEGFGTSLSLSSDGNVLAIGGPEFGDYSGRIQVLKFDPALKSWTEEGTSIEGSEGEEFGVSVALSSDGKRVVGGAPSATFDGSVSEAGAARVYDRDESSVSNE